MQKIRLMRPVTDTIREYLHQRGIKQVKLAKDLNMPQPNLNKKLHQKDIDTSFIIKCSKATGHNFFKDLADELEREMPQPTGYKIPEADITIVAEQVTEFLKTKYTITPKK